MVEAGMPIDIVDELDQTALIKVARTNRTYLVRYLLKKGANVDKQDRYGLTALHLASDNNNTDVMRILLQHGARKDIKNSLGDTPVDWAHEFARDRNQKEALDLLEQY